MWILSETRAILQNNWRKHDFPLYPATIRGWLLSRLHPSSTQYDSFFDVHQRKTTFRCPLLVKLLFSTLNSVTIRKFVPHSLVKALRYVKRKTLLHPVLHPSTLKLLPETKTRSVSTIFSWGATLYPRSPHRNSFRLASFAWWFSCAAAELMGTLYYFDTDTRNGLIPMPSLDTLLRTSRFTMFCRPSSVCLAINRILPIFVWNKRYCICFLYRLW